jgi:phage major head subunit gpT-like protein
MFRYGVDGRLNTGVGFWQMAYASNTDLSNPANFASAISAMKQFKTDAGKPFGALRSRAGIKLLVPTSLEGVAKQLLEADFIAGMGASSTVTTANVYKGAADLIVSEWL